MKQLYSFGKAAMLMAAMTLSALVAQAQQIWPVQMTNEQISKVSDYVVTDFRPDHSSTYVSIHDETYTRDSSTIVIIQDQTGMSAEWTELSLIINNDNGYGIAGYVIGDTASRSAVARMQSTMLEDMNNYYFHFAIKSWYDANQTIYFINDHYTSISFSSTVTGKVENEESTVYYLEDFDRDGEWHDYFLPMSLFEASLWGYSAANPYEIVTVLSSDGMRGDAVSFKDIYFCDGAMRKIMGGSDPISEQEESVNITIDGDFSDWYSLSENVVVNASYNDNNTSRNNLEYMQLCSDGDFLYFYFQYKTDSSVITYPEGGGSVTVCNVDSFRILLNLDDNSETGYYHEGFWSMSGADILISGSWKDNFATADVCTYAGTSAREWTWTAINSIHGAVTACTPVDLSSTSGAIIEGSINLKMLPMDISSLQVGVMSENTSGAISGILPSPERDWSSGESVPQAFLYVPMSQPRLPETITGQCGDSIYWTLNMETGELVLSGQGEMWDLSEITPAYRMDDTPGSVLYLIVEEGIREISGYAFADLYNLTYASLPTTLQTIGISAFSGCSELALIDVPEGVTTIVDQAFLNCSKMATLTLPSTLETIGDYTFAGCPSLQMITCGAYVPPTISESTFRSVSSETPLRVPSEAIALYQADSLWNYFTNIYSMNGGEVENGECGDNVIWRYYPQAQYLEISGSGAMWDFEDASPSYADFRDEVKVVMVEAGVTHIGSSAFLDFNNLQGVSMDSSVTSLGTHVFDNCTTLQYVELPTAITFIPEGTFYNCVSLQGAAIPANVTGIGGVAFYNCNQIQMLMSQPTTPPSLDANVFDGVPSSVPVYVPYESLESYKADQGWSYFSNFIGFIGDSIIMPDTTIVDPQMIEGMCGDSVTWTLKGRTMTITGSGMMWDYSAEAPSAYSQYMQQIDTVMVESGVTTLGANAFNGFPTLKLVVLPYGMKTIGDNAFTDCTSLTFVQMPQDLTTIGASAFQGCENLFVQRLPETLYSIGENAFEACRSITNLVIPNKVNIIGNEAFLQCTGLQSVILPERLGSIAPNMFSFCMSLESVQLPQELGTIGDNAFYACRSLKSITLPETLDDIEGGAFAMCYGLSFIQCEAVLPPTLWDNADNPVFNEVSDSIPVYVPAEAVEAYLHSDWKYFKNIQAIPGDTIVPIEVTVFGITITPDDSTSTEPIDLLGDSTLVYDPQDNTLTFNGLDWEVGEEETTVINYNGSDPLTIVLNDTSTIMADTIIASAADIIITGEGKLVAEGTVPIVGVKSASITFDSVTMHVRSVPSAQALRRRIKSGKRLDETGGPALSGFGSADFNKTNVSPSDAEYGPVTTTDGNGEETTIDALYTTNDEGEREAVTEFDLTAQADNTGVDTVRVRHDFDPSQPMYNVLGLPVDATYKGIVIQGGQTFLLK